MPSCLRAVAVVVFVLFIGLAQAQECGTAAAPACAGTCSDGFVCDAGQGGTPCECVAGTPLALTKLSIKLNFAKADGDGMLVNALIPVPDGFPVAGRMVSFDVGGVSRTMVLDAKGAAKSDGAQVKLSVKSKKGVVAAQDAKLFFKLSNGNFATDLADEGLVDADLINVPVQVVVRVAVDARPYRAPVALLYKAKQGKSGKAANAK